jgi:hypothetical protein
VQGPGFHPHHHKNKETAKSFEGIPSCPYACDDAVEVVQTRPLYATF